MGLEVDALAAESIRVGPPEGVTGRILNPGDLKHTLQSEDGIGVGHGLRRCLPSLLGLGTPLGREERLGGVLDWASAVEVLLEALNGLLGHGHGPALLRLGGVLLQDDTAPDSSTGGDVADREPDDLRDPHSGAQAQVEQCPVPVLMPGAGEALWSRSSYPFGEPHYRQCHQEAKTSYGGGLVAYYPIHLVGWS